MITAVTGMTRCGSTMMMHMLQAGGLPCYADNPVSMETDKMLGLPGASAWLHECEGQAVKLLDPHTFTPPPGLDYRFLLLTRNPDEQAKSMAKFLRFIGTRITDAAIARVANSIRTDLTTIRRLLDGLGPVLGLTFEETLIYPKSVAERIAAFLKLPLDINAMAAVVIPRSPQCYPGMLELETMDMERE